MRKRKSAFLLALLLFLTTGCGKKSAPTPAEEPETPPVIEEPAAEAEVEPLPDVPTGTNPLTGLPIEPEYEQRRPVAVMLNNLKRRSRSLEIHRRTSSMRCPPRAALPECWRFISPWKMSAASAASVLPVPIISSWHWVMMRSTFTPAAAGGVCGFEIVEGGAY